MTEKTSNRFPLLFALVGAVILLTLGGYLFWGYRQNVETPGDDRAGLASNAADSAVAAADMSDTQRKATEAIVRAYILENPEIITEAVEILQKREMAKRVRAAGAKLTTPFAGAEAGNRNGDVTIVEFNDYNCGFCRASVADVDKILANDQNVRVVYREAAILSSTSRDAALWALAAARQGRHREFHKAMFSGDRPSEQSIRSAARRAKLDLVAAEQFAASAAANAEIDANLALMQQTGFSATPIFVIGDTVIEGAEGYDALKAAVDKARKQG